MRGPEDRGTEGAAEEGIGGVGGAGVARHGCAVSPVQEKLLVLGNGTRDSVTRYEWTAYAIMASLIVAALSLRLMPALLAGLLIFEIVHTLAPRVVGRTLSAARARLVAVSLLALLVIGITIAVGAAAVSQVRGEGGGFSPLLQKMAETVESSRELLPLWLHGWLPEGDANALKGWSADWLREHAAEIRRIGGEAGTALMRSVIGMVLGALIALRSESPNVVDAPLARALIEQARRFGEAFRRVVFAQTRISALNTLLTGLYLAVGLPLVGIDLPFVKTMIVGTFVVGLLPIVGNLITNAIIVVISLNHSLAVAICSLVFLVVIHKLEYFANARLVATQINASAWELLIAMLLMETLFGIAGLIAAPIIYAYVKCELSERGLV
jgi:predicted PurR-regulated permease PerM